VLEAVAAAPVDDQLAPERIGLERHGHAPVGVEVLERDRGDVRAVQLRDRRSSAQAYPFDVRVEVEHAR